MTSKINSFRLAILGFLLTLTVMVGLLTTQFLFNYGEEIFGKSIGASATFKILSLGILSSIEFALPISILVMTTIYYRHLSKQGLINIKIKTSLIPSSIFAIACFTWVAFILPVVHLHEGSLLYDIRDKEINMPMKRTNLALFKGTVITSDYSELKGIIDSIFIYTSNKKTEFLENVKANQLRGDNLTRYQEMVNDNIERNNDQINKMRIKKAQMVSFPFAIFILFYTGMFLGILNKGNRILPLLVSIYLTVLPGIYFLSIYFEKLAKVHSISPFQSQLFYITTLLLITTGLYFYTRKHIKERNNTNGNSNQTR